MGCLRWLSGRETHTQAAAIERIEALATWAEMLRDAAGTPRGIEGVLVSTASSAPRPIRPTVARFAERLTYEALVEALPDLADELNHPLGDQIVASVKLSAASGAREIRAVLDDLARAARDEARMLRRLQVSRERPRSDMRQVIAVVATVIGALSFIGRDYLQPYNRLGGQIVLAIAGALWIGGFVWMARLARIELPRRFLTNSDGFGVSEGSFGANPGVGVADAGCCGLGLGNRCVLCRGGQRDGAALGAITARLLHDPRRAETWGRSPRALRCTGVGASRARRSCRPPRGGDRPSLRSSDRRRI